MFWIPTDTKSNKDGEIKGKAFIVPNSGNPKLKVQVPLAI